MGRSLLLASSAILLAVAAAPTASAAQQSLQIREVDTSGFPEVAITIALQEPADLAAADVTIAEDGRSPAEPARVESLEESGARFDVVLAMDTSGSMQGSPMTSAIAAARQFVQGLPQGVRVGVVAFSDAPLVAQRTTTDHGAVLSVLSSLEAAGGTALYDGVGAAAELFSGDAQRNIVLLSDGGDTVSEAGLPAAVKTAEDAGAAVFAVGLSTPATDVSALRTLARDTNGRYAPAETADLSSIYESLATELSNQFLVSYTSPSENGQEVSVSVSALGASDSALVITPRASGLPSPAPPQPVPVPVADPLLGGPVGLITVLTLTFLAVFTLMVMFLGAGARQRRERTLARRVARSPGGAAARHESAEGAAAWLPEGLVAAAQRAAEAGGFARGLDARLERAGLPIRPGEFLAGGGLAVLLGLLVGAVFGKVLLMIFLAVLGAVLPNVFLSLRIQRRTGRFEAQLADILMLLASSLRAGHSFLQALDMVAQEMADPGGHEFSRVVAEVRLGRPVDEALNGVVDRIESEDLRWAVMAVNIQREVGGNLAEILDTVAETIRERETIRRQVRVLSAEGRLSAWILSILPFGFVFYLLVFRPEYLAFLFSDALGIAMVVGAGTLMLFGILWMRRMVKIDV